MAQRETTKTGRPGRVSEYARRTFSSLGVRNYRLYFLGQAVSLTGTFMQGLANGWLVLTLTESAAAVGIVSALQFGPLLFLGPWGGILADRFPKRRLLFITQGASGALALLLWGLVVTGSVRLWMVYAVAGVLGLVNSLDNPVRQTFVYELVGPEQVGNAVTLHSMALNASRIVGPAIAGALIATAGMATCFLVNGVSYAAVLVSLLLMRSSELVRAEPAKRAKGQLRAGFSYVLRTPILRDVLIMTGLVGMLTFEFQVTTAILARRTFGTGAGGYSLLTSAMGIGAVVGGLAIAGLRRPVKRSIILAALAFGATSALVAVSRTLPVAAVAMALVGAASVAFTSISNTLLQLNASPRMRGRVMSLWSTAYVGSTVIGAPFVGWVGDRYSPQWALAIGAVAALAAGAYGLLDRSARGRTLEAAPEAGGASASDAGVREQVVAGRSLRPAGETDATYEKASA